MSSRAPHHNSVKYWSSFPGFKHSALLLISCVLGQFRYPAVQRYIHDLGSEMGEHIDSITSTLSMFIEIGN